MTTSSHPHPVVVFCSDLLIRLCLTFSRPTVLDAFCKKKNFFFNRNFPFPEQNHGDVIKFYVSVLILLLLYPLTLYTFFVSTMGGFRTDSDPLPSRPVHLPQTCLLPLTKYLLHRKSTVTHWGSVSGSGWPLGAGPTKQKRCPYKGVSIRTYGTDGYFLTRGTRTLHNRLHNLHDRSVGDSITLNS